MEKNFASLRVLFAANPESVNLTDLRRMKLFAENGLKELNGAENSDDSMLLVCHGAIMRIIETYFRDMPMDEFYHYSPENCKLVRYIL